MRQAMSACIYLEIGRLSSGCPRQIEENYLIAKILGEF